MGQKRSKNQIRRERLKLRKAGNVESKPFEPNSKESVDSGARTLLSDPSPGTKQAPESTGKSMLTGSDDKKDTENHTQATKKTPDQDLEAEDIKEPDSGNLLQVPGPVLDTKGAVAQETSPQTQQETVLEKREEEPSSQETAHLNASRTADIARREIPIKEGHTENVSLDEGSIEKDAEDIASSHKGPLNEDANDEGNSAGSSSSEKPSIESRPIEKPSIEKPPIEKPPIEKPSGSLSVEIIATQNTPHEHHEKDLTEDKEESQTGRNFTTRSTSEHEHRSSDEAETAADRKTQIMDIFSRLKDPLSTQPTSAESLDSLLSQYASVFHKFEARAEPQRQMVALSDAESTSSEMSSSDESADEASGRKPMSKRQKRLREKIPISVLKASATRPQAVEWHDADAPDPYMAVYMKTALNHVAVPLHWQQKKDYLSSKRGMERPPFELPKFIENTGIAEMRNHDPESLKKLQRDRVQPKMGRLDIDYQKLHDAFFKHQTRPRMLAYGELYSEGREKADQYNHDVARMRPGKISLLLRLAVGMLESETAVPPWITVMHELGKPPSYLNLLIPGLDIEYTNLGYQVQYGEKGQALGLLVGTWGALEDGEESEADLEELESEAEDSESGIANVTDAVSNSSGETDSGLTAVSNDEQPEKVEIAEYSKIKKSSSSQSATASLGSLYKIIKEKSADGSEASGDGKLRYELEGKEESAPKRARTTHTVSEDTENFRF